jgi:hypothetical protein
MSKCSHRKFRTIPVGDGFRLRCSQCGLTTANTRESPTDAFLCRVHDWEDAAAEKLAREAKT